MGDFDRNLYGSHRTVARTLIVGGRVVLLTAAIGVVILVFGNSWFLPEVLSYVLLFMTLIATLVFPLAIFPVGSSRLCERHGDELIVHAIAGRRVISVDSVSIRMARMPSWVHDWNVAIVHDRWRLKAVIIASELWNEDVLWWLGDSIENENRVLDRNDTLVGFLLYLIWIGGSVGALWVLFTVLVSAGW